MDLKYPIAYLEAQDFGPDGNLVNPKLKGKPVFIMLQAGFCGHCSTAKPSFQAVADTGLITCATIQADGTRESEKKLGQMVSKVYPGEFLGFPSYLLILPSGEKIPHEGKRDTEALKDFISQHY